MDLILAGSVVFALSRWCSLVPSFVEWRRRNQRPALRLIDGGLSSVKPRHVKHPPAA